MALANVTLLHPPQHCRGGRGPAMLSRRGAFSVVFSFIPGQPLRRCHSYLPGSGRVTQSSQDLNPGLCPPGHSLSLSSGFLQGALVPPSPVHTPLPPRFCSDSKGFSFLGLLLPPYCRLPVPLCPPTRKPLSAFYLPASSSWNPPHFKVTSCQGSRCRALDIKPLIHFLRGLGSDFHFAPRLDSVSELPGVTFSHPSS